MPSIALQNWISVRLPMLNEIEQAHQAVGGSGRGRRYATQQINHAYTVLLSSQFQGFCRDFHTECVDAYVRVTPASLQYIIHDGLLRDRRLDRGNPNPGNIGADFGRFRLLFWQEVYAHDTRNNGRRLLLEELNEWRNAIAHQDFTRIGNVAIQLQQVRRYRGSCEALIGTFDKVMESHLTSQLGVAPW
jgi:hypothetical protein